MPPNIFMLFLGFDRFDLERDPVIAHQIGNVSQNLVLFF
jgi:hypothetical protein